MVHCKKTPQFDAKRDIPQLDGKVILVTGGNVGLGKQAILDYAQHNPAQIWLAARNLDKAAAAVKEIQEELPNTALPPIHLLQLDLSSLESVKNAARTFMAQTDRLDILMLNAGIMAAPPALTKDGYEVQFATNYLGHALFTKLLLPVLGKTAARPGADVRIVTVSSDLHTNAPKEGIRFDAIKSQCEDMSAYERYGQSKLAQILWARQMAKLYPQFTVASIHPGVVRTNLQAGATGQPRVLQFAMNAMHFMLTPVEQGVRNQLWATVSKDVQSGEYYHPVGVGGEGSKLARDGELANKLWEWSEKNLANHTI
ncbi:short-chain dehydrogenase/reductase [Corynespora cassiicola Philippines]|uniref:Short-chain dehydrogenase/reductase n=1 Tax=Corynespora cassiicola Philippines TaxID=1448308 RepID=A0A2T2P1A9_CORCC|nr:short-chain dehydrogenase/reductase [Corynespora cassiicola Philippines]